MSYRAMRQNLPSEICDYLQHIATSVKRAMPVRDIYLFGSYADGTFRYGRSDLDIFVVTPDKSKRRIEWQWFARNTFTRMDNMALDLIVNYDDIFDLLCSEKNSLEYEVYNKGVKIDDPDNFQNFVEECSKYKPFVDYTKEQPKFDIEELPTEIKDYLHSIVTSIKDAMPVRDIYLFGDYADGTYRPDRSYMNIFIVTPDKSKREIDWQLHVRNTIDRYLDIPMNFVVCYDDVFDIWQNKVGYLEYEVYKKGVIINDI